MKGSNILIHEQATKEQIAAVERARELIREDGDRAGMPRMHTNFTVAVVQYDNSEANRDEIVRTWVAYPNGRLTWIS